MSQTAKLTTPQWTQDDLNELIIDAIQDIKGKNILKLDLRRIEDAPTDFFIICEGDSSTQVKAISDNIHRRIKDDYLVMPNHIEGHSSSTWICLDYFNTVVHVFYRQTREFYDLETLWGDANVTEYETL
ncbi:MAG: ribosome silencing factor [Lewinella sp.]|nr:ribosome silencing factor [Lewinella sp.]